MRLCHLGLPVLDLDRSLRFYVTYFDFIPETATKYPDGTVIISNADGIELALHVMADPTPLPEYLHFGFRVDSADQVRNSRALLLADGHTLVDDYDEAGLVSFKVLDPDGHPIETYWKP